MYKGHQRRTPISRSCLHFESHNQSNRLSVYPVTLLARRLAYIHALPLSYYYLTVVNPKPVHAYPLPPLFPYQHESPNPPNTRPHHPNTLHTPTAVPTNGSSALAAQIHPHLTTVSLNTLSFIPAPNPPSLSLNNTSLVPTRNAHVKGTIATHVAAASAMDFHLPSSSPALSFPPSFVLLISVLGRHSSSLASSP